MNPHMSTNARFRCKVLWTNLTSEDSVLIVSGQVGLQVSQLCESLWTQLADELLGIGVANDMLSKTRKTSKSFVTNETFVVFSRSTQLLLAKVLVKFFLWIVRTFRIVIEMSWFVLFDKKHKFRFKQTFLYTQKISFDIFTSDISDSMSSTITCNIVGLLVLCLAALI